MFTIEAAQRLNAARASTKDSLAFLTELGFKDLKLKTSEDNLIKFWYKSYDQKELEKYLGEPKSNSVPATIRYSFGTQGQISIWPANKTVVLKNTEVEGLRVRPTETHVPPHIEVPVQKPVAPHKPEAPVHTPVTPNTPGSKENDDSHVPVTHISADLEKRYSYLQGIQAPADQLLMFNKRLWTYLNETKFAGKMQMPTLKLLKNQSAQSMRLRGRWWPGKRLLEVAPRLYNAHQNFFVEVFLHEMCHQAVSEIDRINEVIDQGHGPTWRKWMRHVGLNPLRFDPNDNTTYMTKEELQKHQEKKSNAESQIEAHKLVRIMPRRNLPAVIFSNGQMVQGMIVCSVTMSKWAFLSQADMKTFKATNKIAWFKVDTKSFYSTGDLNVETYYDPEWEKQAQRIVAYYYRKSVRF